MVYHTNLVLNHNSAARIICIANQTRGVSVHPSALLFNSLLDWKRTKDLPFHHIGYFYAGNVPQQNMILSIKSDQRKFQTISGAEYIGRNPSTIKARLFLLIITVSPFMLVGTPFGQRTIVAILTAFSILNNNFFHYLSTKVVFDIIKY